MRCWLLCATLAAAVLPRSAGAQSQPLTESEALARLSADGPRVKAIRAAIEIARADVLLAGRWPNPRVTVDRQSVGGTTEYLATVGQPLPITGQRGLQVRAASASVDAGTARADDEVRRVRADLRLAFTDLVWAQAREREIGAARDRLRGVADVLGKREAAGDAAGFDRLRAEREVIDFDADFSIAASDRARAQAALAGFFSEPIDPSRILAAESALASVPLPSIDMLMERAEATRGELLALHKDIEAADWSLRAADRRRLPEPEIVAGTKSSSGSTRDVGSVVAVQAVIPLFDHGRPERALAQGRASQAEARIAALRASLHAEITGWRSAILERRAAADRYRAAVISSADQIARIAEVSYEAGERGILELLDAYRTTASARIRQAALDTAVRQAEIELEFLSGWEIK